MLNRTFKIKFVLNCFRLDFANIFEFLLKWQKNKGLDTKQVLEHEQYITVLCQKVKNVLAKRLSQVAEEIGGEMSCSVYQDVLINAKYCKELLIHYKVFNNHMSSVWE